MTQPNPSTAMARAVIDELANNGVELVVISPGSRSGALAIAAAEHVRVIAKVVIDERSAAFHALGRAKATGAPAAVISTSGSAPANFFPAVVEADMSLTPLVVISADRPAELRGIGANQTIDQVALFGSKVRYWADMEAPGHEEDSNGEWRTTVSTAVGAASGSGSRPGPVHLNLAFREPTVPVADDGRTAADIYRHSIAGRPGDAPWVAHEVSPPPDPQVNVPSLPKGIVIAGEGSYDGDALLSAAKAIGWPVIATALSGLRGLGTLSSYHHLLADGVPDRLRPEVVVAVGSVGPSIRLEELIASARFRFRVDPLGRNIDPGRNATSVLHADPVKLLDDIDNASGQHDWHASWHELDRNVCDATEGYISRLDRPSGAGIALAFNELEWRTLVAASSLPIREVDAHLRKGGRVLANRGASGIDGFVSTALGVASAGQGVIALCGDLSLLHDSNGFLADPIDDLVLVVVDNNGGGLFDSLPQARHAPHFERIFITPHHRRLEHLADLHRLGYSETTSLEELPTLVAAARAEAGANMIRIPVERDFDLAVRQALDRLGAGLARSGQT